LRHLLGHHAHEPVAARRSRDAEADARVAGGRLDHRGARGDRAAPLGVVEELAAAGKIRLIPLEGKEIDALVAKAPYMTKAEIPAGTYRNMPAVPSIEVRAIWLVNADVPNDLVFAIVRALFHPDNRGLLDSGHPKGKLIPPARRPSSSGSS